MLRENPDTVDHRVLQVFDRLKADEAAVVRHFAARVNALGPLAPASPGLQAHLLAELQALARRLDTSAETGAASGYKRRLLHEEPDRWSLALIILRPGQHTHPHNHDGWGGAVTVQGVERNRRFIYDASGRPIQIHERDHPPGSGYLFDAAQVHQPVGADPEKVTVALHFLVSERLQENGHAKSTFKRRHPHRL